MGSYRNSRGEQVISYSLFQQMSERAVLTNLLPCNPGCKHCVQR